jgi:shikimate kinase/3-dehydroquinate synthase
LVERGFIYPSSRRRYLIADSQVAELHPLTAEWQFGLQAAETEKTLANVEAVVRHMARSGVGREDIVIALGGGVIGDLAGFCAAIYQRGVPVCQVPTTLVGQVDSAYGGKTGVDLPEGKNYIGAYHQPAAVVCDPATLETLDSGEFAAGYAEVLKTALIAGGSLWERVRAGHRPDEEMILACARTKLAIVASDERDAHSRQVLNLGHTVGHAIEAATGYSKYRHGEAVAVGLLCALRLSGLSELHAEVTELLTSFDLPVAIEGASVEDIVKFVGRDKKQTDGGPGFVLADGPGRVTSGHSISPGALRSAVEEVLER